jgi:hypothetical protein
MTLLEAKAHMADVFKRLQPGGIFEVIGPDVRKCCQHYLNGEKQEALQGLVSDPHTNHLPGWAHLSGWDSETLSEALAEVGFEIDYAGSSDSPHCSWRDYKVEAAKP